MPVIKNCLSCNKEYKVAASKAAKSKYCSITCRNRGINESKKIPRKRSKCQQCNSFFLEKINESKSFCSQTCYYASIKKERVTVNCPVCKKDYETLKDNSTKFCSQTCRNYAQSSGIQSIPRTTRAGYRRDLPEDFFFKSALEADFARYCNWTNKKWIYEYKTFQFEMNGYTRSYTPDFYLPEDDLYIETKAKRRDSKYDANLAAAALLKRDHGINLEVVFMRPFYKDLRDRNLFWVIPHLEFRDYPGTKWLAYQEPHERDDDRYVIETNTEVNQELV